MYGIFTYIWVIFRANVRNIPAPWSIWEWKTANFVKTQWFVGKSQKQIQLDAESQETALPSSPLVSRNDWFLSSIGPHQLTFDLTVVKWHLYLTCMNGIRFYLTNIQAWKIWHFIRQSLTVCLTCYRSLYNVTVHLAFYLTCIYMYIICMTIFETYSDILSDMFIPSDIQSGMKNMTCYDILADIWPRILSGILSDILSDYVFFWHTFWTSIWHIIWPSYRHVFILSQFIWHAIWHMFWHFIWHIFLLTIGHSIGHIFCHVVWHSNWHNYYNMRTLYLQFSLIFWTSDIYSIRTFYLTSWHYIWHSPESLGATHAPGESERGFANPSVWSFQGLIEFVEYLSGFAVWFVAKQSSSHNFRHVFCSHSDICIIISVA